MPHTTSSDYNQSCVLNENYVDSAVYNFTSCVSEAINETIPSVKTKNPLSLTVFRNFLYLLLYIKNKNYFLRNINLITIIVLFLTAVSWSKPLLWQTAWIA